MPAGQTQTRVLRHAHCFMSWRKSAVYRTAARIRIRHGRHTELEVKRNALYTQVVQSGLGGESRHNEHGVAARALPPIGPVLACMATTWSPMFRASDLGTS